MAICFVPRFCLSCDIPVLEQKQRPNHILHLLLTLLTCGFWLIPWALMSLPSTLRCPNCGSSHTTSRRPRPHMNVAVTPTGVVIPAWLTLVQYAVVLVLAVAVLRFVSL